MTIGGTGDDRLNKNQRRDAAREKARQLRVGQQKKERRNRALLQGGLIIVALGIVAVVTLIIISSIRPPARGPLNMASDGIVIGQEFTAESTPALEAGEEPVRSTPAEDDPIAIEVYLDYQCPFCRDFEETNADQIANLVEQGVATVEYRPVAILDRASAGSRYSTRSANAAACVANYAPDSYYDVNAALFQRQPEEQTEGLTDEQLIALVEDAGATDERIATCITDERFENWVAAATERATSDPALEDENGAFGTPRILVNGELYEGPVDDETSFTRFIAEADSAAFAEENTSPSPTPTPTP